MYQCLKQGSLAGFSDMKLQMGWLQRLKTFHFKLYSKKGLKSPLESDINLDF